MTLPSFRRNSSLNSALRDETRTQLQAILDSLDPTPSGGALFTPQTILETHLYRHPRNSAGNHELASCLNHSFSPQDYLEDGANPKVLEAHSQLVQQIIASQANLKDENILTFRFSGAADPERSLLSLRESITTARGGRPPTVVVSFGHAFGIEVSSAEADPIVEKATAELHGLSRSVSLSELQANPRSFLEGLKHLHKTRPDLANQIDEALKQIDLFSKVSDFLSRHSSDARIYHGLPNIPRAQYGVHIPGSAAENHVLVGATNPSGNLSSYSVPHSSYVEATGRGTVLYVPRDFKPDNSPFNHSVLLVSSEFISKPSGDIAGHFLDERTLSSAEEKKVRSLVQGIHSSETSASEKEAKLEELQKLIKDRVLPISLGYEVLGAAESYKVFEGVPHSKRWIQITDLALERNASTSPDSSVTNLSFNGYLYVSVTDSSGRAVLSPIATGHSWATPDHAAAELRKAQSNSWTVRAQRKPIEWLPFLGFGTLVASIASFVGYQLGRKGSGHSDPNDPTGTESQVPAETDSDQS